MAHSADSTAVSPSRMDNSVRAEPEGFDQTFTSLSCDHCRVAVFKIHFGGDNMDKDRENKTVYKVVVNHEEQYSIWPTHKENARGWSDGGKSGSKDECLEYIKEVWTDMRPLSLRKRMQENSPC
jgi:MbtH protein